jgi:hypothetical protein
VRGGFLKQAWLRTPMLSRMVWVLMVVLHAPALVKAWSSFVGGGFDLSHVGGPIALSLSMAFFALKLRGAASLRFRADRRSAVAICLILAFIHVDVLRTDSGVAVLPECAKIVATTVLVAGLTRVRRVLSTALIRARSKVGRRLPSIQSNETVWHDAFRPRCWVLASRLYSLRAPPA